MLGKVLSRLLDRREQSYFRPREFAAELDLRPHTQAERERTLARACAFNERRYAVPGLVQAHLMWPPLVRLYGREVHVENPYGPMLFYCRYEGDLEDVLSMLIEASPELRHDVLQRAWGYPGGHDVEGCVRQLMAARRHPSRAQREGCAVQPAPKPEVSGALPSMSPFERPIPDEHQWIERMTGLLETRMRRATREARAKDPASVARRGAHVKHHGLIEADFVVHSDVPEELQRGIFEPGAVYRAQLRVSNMSESQKPDDAPDARGLAIKLHGVEKCGQPVTLPGSEHDQEAFTQDFNLASDPAFFIRDIRDYTIARSIFNLRDQKAIARELALYFARRPRDMWIFYRSVVRCRPDHPLNISYHSMTASALGSAFAVKYLVRPLPPKPAVVSGKRRGPDHLRGALRRSLDPVRGRPLRLEFCVVLPDEATPEWVEDARLGVRKSDRIVPVATIEIERQDPCSEERLRDAEALVFSPWHTLREHRPLGNLNRARFWAYRTSARLRSSDNAGAVEPRAIASHARP